MVSELTMFSEDCKPGPCLADFGLRDQNSLQLAIAANLILDSKTLPHNQGHRIRCGRDATVGHHDIGDAVVTGSAVALVVYVKYQVPEAQQECLGSRGRGVTSHCSEI